MHVAAFLIYVGYKGILRINFGILHSITSKGKRYIHRHHQHSPALPSFTYIQELMIRSQQRPSWLSWHSVALDSRGREFDSHQRPWSCIFRNWSRLSLRNFTHSQKYPYRLPLIYGKSTTKVCSEVPEKYIHENTFLVLLNILFWYFDL